MFTVTAEPTDPRTLSVWPQLLLSALPLGCNIHCGFTCEMEPAVPPPPQPRHRQLYYNLEISRSCVEAEMDLTALQIKHVTWTFLQKLHGIPKTPYVWYVRHTLHDGNKRFMTHNKLLRSCMWWGNRGWGNGLEILFFMPHWFILQWEKPPHYAHLIWKGPGADYSRPTEHWSQVCCEVSKDPPLQHSDSQEDTIATPYMDCWQYCCTSKEDFESLLSVG